jgi:hypothetical protein
MTITPECERSPLTSNSRCSSGPGHLRGEERLTSEFESDAARREAWFAHRDEIQPARGPAWAEEEYGSKVPEEG